MLKLLMPKLNIFTSVAYVLSITHYFLGPIHCIGHIYQVYGPLIPALITIDHNGGHFAGVIESPWTQCKPPYILPSIECTPANGDFAFFA